MNPKKLLRKSYVTFIIIFWGLWSVPQICTGLDIFRPVSHTDLALKTTNPGNAYDTDTNSAADIETNVDAFPSIVFDTFSPTTTSVYSSLILKVIRSSTGHIDDKWGIKYSTDGGSNWSSLNGMSSQNIATATATAMVDLNTSLDLNQLQVRIDTDRKKKADSGHVHIYDIWVEGEEAPTPTLEQSAYRFFGVNDSNDFYEKVSNIPGTDEAKAMAIDSSSMYVVGFELGKWRIEKRNLNDGDLIYGITNEDTWGEANAIAIDGAYMYVAGEDYTGDNYRWRIEKRRLSNLSLDLDFGIDGVVISDPSGNNDAAFGIAIDGTHMYVVGSDRSLGASDAQWRIEKRACSDGSLEDVTVVNFSVDDDIPYAIAVDSTSMYVVGYDRIPGSSNKPGKGNKGSSSSNAEWRIEKRSLSDLSVLGSVNSNPTDDFDTARGIAIDGTHMYVIGSDELGFFDTRWHIEKRDLSDLLSLNLSFGTDGIITEDYGYDDRPTAIAIDGTHMYVAGFSSDPGSGGDTAWRIEKRLLSDGSLVEAVVNDIDSENNDRAFAIAVDTSYMYVAGYFTNFSLPDWRIVKRELSDLSLDLLENLSTLTLLQDQPVNLNNGDEFRLKMLLHVDGDPLPFPSNLYQFKLQYSDSSSSTFYDITDITPIAFKDNPIASDGTALSILGSGDDPSHSGHTTLVQTFEEANNFTNSESAIEDGQDGMWDFSLYVVNSADPDTYTFRIVIDDGTPLNFYSIYPVVTVP